MVLPRNWFAILLLSKQLENGFFYSISVAASGEDGCLELLDVVSESEIYTTDQEPTPSVSFEREDIVPEPPEQISLFSNRSVSEFPWFSSFSIYLSSWIQQFGSR